jgi:hypothetical protein
VHIDLRNMENFDRPNDLAICARSPGSEMLMSGSKEIAEPEFSCAAKTRAISSRRRGRQFWTWCLMALIVSAMAAWLGFIGWGVVSATKLLL